MDVSNKKIVILGSTGSVGCQAIDVAAFHNIKVEGISGSTNIQLLEKQIRQFSPKFCAVSNEIAARNLKIAVADTNVKILTGNSGICEMAYEANADILLNSIIGKAGLYPTLSAIKSKKTIALANKETLVTAGEIIMREARNNNISIIPVDSEHSAIFQCMKNESKKQISKIILTASGGPFWGKSRDKLANISVTEALAHPTWKMGAKITIDSATLMNKGFEVIEAVHLFGVDTANIEVLIHRESIIHSMVEYIDNAIMAQLSVPDMRMCIQYAITFPDRVESQLEHLDLTKIRNMSFYKPDMDTFILLPLAIKAINLGGILPAVLNAANERAVDLFLKEKISFTDIFDIVSDVVNNYANIANPKIEDIETADIKARLKVDELISL